MSRDYNKEKASKIFRISNQKRTRNDRVMLEEIRFKKETGKNWF